MTPTSGLLVRDINGNGMIDNGHELFGDNTLMKNGKCAENGFLALKSLCDSRDGIFDKRSAAYSTIYIWFDVNSDGISGMSELVSLSEAGIVSIDLNYRDSDEANEEESKFRQISTATLENETILDIATVRCSYVARLSQAVYKVEVSDEVKELPDIREFGTVYSLHQEMMMDESGELQNLVEQFVSESNESVRRELTGQIFHKWTRSTSNLEALVAITGNAYNGGTGPSAMKIINGSFDNFVNTLYEILMSQSHYRDLYEKMNTYTTLTEGIDFTWVADELLAGVEADRIRGEELIRDYLYNVCIMEFVNDMNVEGFQEKMTTMDLRSGIYAEILTRFTVREKVGNAYLSGTEQDDIF